MNQQTQFCWVDFYIEFANKLLSYKERRAELLEILEAAHTQAGLSYPFMDKGNPLADICPFTVFAAFNKGISDGNRSALLKALASRMDIQATVPIEFDGIPVLNNMRSWFFSGEGDRGVDDIEFLWEMFESALKLADDQTENNRQNFISYYNRVIQQNGIKWNITMGLYWVRPNSYLNLDGRNRQFLLESEETRPIGISSIFDLKQLPEAEKYLELVEQCKESFLDGNVPFTSFPKLSLAAWLSTVAEKATKDKKVSNARSQWFKPLIEALKELGGSATPEAARKKIILIINNHKLYSTRYFP